MQIKQVYNHRQPSIKTFPKLRESNSVAALIIYGDKNSLDSVDSLMSYKKDYATMARQQKQRYLKRKSDSLQRKKQDNITREIIIKKKQQIPLIKTLQKQKRSSEKYQSGQLVSVMSNSIAANPLNLEYHHNKKGEVLAKRQQDKQLNRSARAHYLHTIGNSGYNIITGKSSLDLQKFIPKHQHQAFQNKLKNIYSNFSIFPPNLNHNLHPHT